MNERDRRCGQSFFGFDALRNVAELFRVLLEKAREGRIVPFRLRGVEEWSKNTRTYTHA